jgi:hypothetical protein
MIHIINSTSKKSKPQNTELENLKEREIPNYHSHESSKTNSSSSKKRSYHHDHSSTKIKSSKPQKMDIDKEVRISSCDQSKQNSQKIETFSDSSDSYDMSSLSCPFLRHFAPMKPSKEFPNDEESPPHLKKHSHNHRPTSSNTDEQKEQSPDAEHETNKSRHHPSSKRVSSHGDENPKSSGRESRKQNVSSKKESSDAKPDISSKNHGSHRAQTNSPQNYIPNIIKEDTFL